MLAALFLAIGEVKLRADAGIESVALRELRARFRIAFRPR